MGVVRLSISVEDILSVMATFHSMRVKRSTTGLSGAYNLITADVPGKAVLVAPAAGPYAVAGMLLQITRDSHPVADVTFPGLAPLTTTQAADYINSALGVMIASDQNNHLQLESTITGTASKIRISGGGSVPFFGWTVGDRDIGEDAHIPLVSPITMYEYVDNDGEPLYYYKVQYYNASSGLVSNDSSPFQGAVSTMVGVDKLSVCYVDLVNASGVAVSNQEVTFYSVHEPLVVEGFDVALVRSPVVMLTDTLGHAEVRLVRGLKMRVVFEGTSVIREFVVPDAPSFDLLQLIGTAPDPFRIKVVNFPEAPRRTI